MPANSASMMRLTTIRPSKIIGHLGLAQAIHVDGYAAEDQSDQHERERAQKEARPPQRHRLVERILGDRPEHDADDERRPRPFVALEQIAEPAERDEQDQV